MCEDALDEFDYIQKIILEDTLNLSLSPEAWKQATLPVKNGGLGIRKASDLALPAFFSSLHASSVVANQILPGDNHLITDMSPEAATTWQRLAGLVEVPEEPTKQKSWDKPIVERAYQSLKEGSINTAGLARITAVTGPCAGAWLEATPSTNLGTKLDDEAVRIAASLRLGAPICIPHTSQCSKAVESNGLHGLDCGKGSGRFARHSELNTIIHRSLSSINRPSILEPTGLTRTDGRRPDGMTLFPWHCGKPLVWDVTCVSTLASSNLNLSLSESGSAAEQDKCQKYRDLDRDYKFIPLGFETIGHWGPFTICFVGELGKLLTLATGEPRSTSFLRQRLSIAIQRGNAACIRGTVPQGEGLLELFNLPYGS